MKQLALLIEYDLRAVKKPLLVLAFLLGPLELAVALMGFVSDRGPLYAPPYLVLQNAEWVPLVFVLMALFLGLWADFSRQGKSKGIYTLMTLPVHRASIYFASVLSSLMAMLFLLAAQALWFVILYEPAGWASDVFSNWYRTYRMNDPALAAELVTNARVSNGLFLSMVRSPFMGTLLPVSFMGFARLLLSLAAPCTCLRAVTCRRGAARAVQLVLGLCSLYLSEMLLFEIPGWSTMDDEMLLICFAGQLLLMGISMLNAIYGLKKAKNL